MKARDKNGLPRVMEALQSVMWSSMRKLSSSNKPKSTVALTDSSSLPPPPPQSTAITETKEVSYFPLDDGEKADTAENEDEKLLDTFTSALEHVRYILCQCISS